MFRGAFVCLGVSVGFAGCVQKPAEKAEIAPAPRCAPEQAGLSNLLQLTDDMYSGSEPHGEAGFESLAKLGVKTIVSVDGAKPDVEAAHAHGMKYVHIPIGYDGVSQDATASLSRLAREQSGTIYVHCHHGQHRGPAAAAIACIASGKYDAAGATKILEAAGTDKNYRGLWRDVAAFSPPAPDAKLPDLVEVAEVGSLASAMAQLDRAFDNLKLCRGAKWQTPADHPDIVPSQEALIVKESLHEAGRQLDASANEQFRVWLAEAEQQAAAVETSLKPLEPNAAESGFVVLEKSCKRCHAAYRNVSAPDR